MKRVFIPFTVMLAFCLGLWTSNSLAVSEEAISRGVPSLAPMLETVTPAVVSIRVSKASPTGSRYFFEGNRLPGYRWPGQRFPEDLRRFFQNEPGTNNGSGNGSGNRSDNGPGNESRRPFAVGAGSGVIVDAEAGYIVTNHHVVDGANNITVQLSDARVLEAQLVGSDANTDVALLQVDADRLTDIELAEIDSVQVGDYVVAIGNPFGIGQTVTSGIVSALGRTGLNDANYEDFIQTDAAINVGNSGGALVDMEGRLIGINTAIISGDGGNNGIGFAVPVDMVAAVTDHLERDGEVRRGMLGVSIISLTPEATEALDLSVDSGALVTSVLPDSAAERAGIQVSDVIFELDGESISGGRDLRNRVGLLRRDQKIELLVNRDGESMSVLAVIGDENGGASLADNGPGQRGGFRGARLRDVSEADDTQLDGGVMVDTVDPQSRAWRAGLRAGDVIIQVNRQSVDSLDEFDALLEGSSRFTAMTVVREDREVLLLVP